MKTFRRELISLINRHSKENGSNTPDYILADYLIECLNNFNKTTNMRNDWYEEKTVVDEGYKKFMEKVSETVYNLKRAGDKINVELINTKFSETQKNAIDYNNIRARATLYPGKTIEEVNELQYRERLQDSYDFVNSVLKGTKPTNNKEIREWVTKTLEGRLRKYGVVVICSANNNPAEVVDKNLLVARVVRSNDEYADLTFGDETIAREYNRNL